MPFRSDLMSVQSLTSLGTSTGLTYLKRMGLSIFSEHSKPGGRLPR
jgi:hypothetical protein